jgi:Protein of unknown function (DUF3810)
VVAVAALGALVPIPAGDIDRLYSAGIYPVVQRALTRLSNVVPIALLDVLIVATIVAVVAAAWRDWRQAGAAATAVGIAVRVLTIAAGVYVVFLVCWGLNYRRTPLMAALEFDAQRVTSDAAQQAAAIAVARLNALHDAAHAAGFPAAGATDAGLVDGLHSAVADLGRGAAIHPARPKTTMLDWYFRRAGVDGMTDPFFLETLVSSDIEPFERPFIVAHEWSHLAGFGDEGDANFVGWLACLRSPPSAQYSGWLFFYSEVAQSLGARDAATIAGRLAAGPRADLRAIRDRIVRQVNPQVAAAGWRAYDAYLKANRVEAGTKSYAHVVRLALGARLPSGEPALPAYH